MSPSDEEMAGLGTALGASPGGIEMDQTRKRILVAGIGNAWMKDDAFGGKVAEKLEGGVLPEQAAVFDFGTGGLDLAYEAMRGYDALILIDISRQGGEPGTLYVMDAEPEDLEPIEDGEMLSPHGMDPETVLRFVKAVGGWPGKVKIVACEPAVVEEMGLEMSDAVSEAVERAVGVVKETVAELLTDAAYDDLDEARAAAPGDGRRRRPAMHELSVSSAIVDTAIRHARGRKVNAVHVQVGSLRQVVPSSLEFYFGITSRDTVCDGAELDLDLIRGADALRRVRARVGSGPRAAV